MPPEQTPATEAAPGSPPVALRRRRGTDGNRFKKIDQQDHGESEASGIFAGMAHRSQVGDPQAVVQVEVSRIAPHPYNDPSRSAPQPGNPKWDELVESVRTMGVQIPSKIVTRAAFLAVRPETEETIGEADFVAVYGHRRRAAVIDVGQLTLPSFVDDAIMHDDGDLVALTTENLGREDFSELAEAQLFARWSEQVGLSQREIAAKLGVHQGTVSRRLALLLLGPEATAALEDQQLNPTEAASLAGKLPYGPPRGWQKNPDPEQSSRQRLTDQSSALALILGKNMSAGRAAELVVAEKASRAKAAAEGLSIVDPKVAFGSKQAAHRLYADDAVRAAAAAGNLVTAIDPDQGTLAYYASSVLNPEEVEAEAQQAARHAADNQRRTCCARVAVSTPSKDALTDVLITQRLLNLAAVGTPAWELASSWLSEAGRGTRSAKELMEAAAETTDRGERQELAWLMALATYELHATDAERWGPPEKAYLRLLHARGDYTPTAWEQAALDTIAD
ncbi:MAG TPA: hypothetical protein VGL36_35515 [Kribbella sp.]